MLFLQVLVVHLLPGSKAVVYPGTWAIRTHIMQLLVGVGVTCQDPNEGIHGFGFQYILYVYIMYIYTYVYVYV